MKELMPLQNINAVAIFSEGGLDKLLEQIHTEAESHVPDLETDKGRKAIASIAAKVAKSKTYLDGLGKDMVSVWKNQAKVVDAERRKMRDDLDELKITIRKPLTDYEQAEDARIANITETIQETIGAGNDAVENYLSRNLESMIDRLGEIEGIDPADGFGEFEERMSEVRLVAKTQMKTAIEKRKQHDADQAELEKLRKEAAEREEAQRMAIKESQREEREKRIAEEAAEKAKADAERKAQEETARIEAEKQKAINDKKAAEKRVIEAEKKAKIDSENAAKAEREKIEVERMREKEAAEKREANTRHRRKINNQSVNCLISKGIEKETAVIVITAIAKKEIDNVTIAY